MTQEPFSLTASAKELADSYVVAYTVTLKTTGREGEAHYAALKAMELAAYMDELCKRGLPATQ